MLDPGASNRIDFRMPELHHSSASRPDEVENSSLLAQNQTLQSHGLLFVLSEPDLVIRQVSQNCARITGRSPASLLGKPIEAVLGRSQRTALENITLAAPVHLPEQGLSFALVVQGERRPFNAFLHRRDGQLLLELEPARILTDTELARALNQAAAALAAIECEFDLQRLSGLAVRAIREILRYDRAVLYLIDKQGNGTVIAEDRAADTAMPALLGEIVPGDSSIPARIVRERRRRLRELRDFRGRTTTLMPQLNPVTGARINLGHAFLRGPSPSTWKQRLTEQGVRGKVRVNVTVEGELWGLIICHHERPRSLSRELRRIVLDVAKSLSRQIALVQKRAGAERQSTLSLLVSPHHHRAETDAVDERLRSIMENLAHGVIIFSAQGKPLFANSAAARIYDLGAQALLHALAAPESCHLRADGSELPAEQTPMRLAIDSGEAVNDYRMGISLADGSVRWTTASCRPVHDAGESGQMRLVMSLHDVSEQQRIERDLQLLAHFDTLTGLPNRALLKERFDQALLQIDGNPAGEGLAKASHVGMVIIGLDRFKEINDTLGTAAGDQVLQEVARRLQALLGDARTVARFGGDEFAVLVLGTSRDEIAQAAALCRQALDAPAHVDGNEIFIGGSVGCSVFPDDGDSRDELLRNADIAMNEAKAEGGNGLRMFSRELQARSGRELSMGAKLRRALDRGELAIAYQPQVNMITGEVLGLEALMRWNNPELGVVPPTQFIRIAEDTGLILPMGEWLLKTVCEQNRAWQRAGLRPVTVAVNLSARQFRDRQLAQKVSSALSATGLDARWLEFEITESVIMQDTQHNTETLEDLVSLGAKVAVDDFGTGYSSLAYLKRFPVHVLKIDRTFVRDISTDRDDAAIVRTIVALAHALELGVVAEGVETADQLRFLAQLKCDLYQGYYFSKPVSAEEIVKLLKR